MSDPRIPARPISPEEIAVVRATLQRAAFSPAFITFAESLDHLMVVDRCHCGCASVDFEVNGQAGLAAPIADAIATTPSGCRVGVLVWGRVDRVTGLEVYGLSSVEGDDLRLPTLDSIEPV